MNKLEYFIHSIKNKLHYDRRWLLAVVSMPMVRSKGLYEIPSLTQDGKSVAIQLGEETIIITDAKVDAPLYGKSEKFTLPPGVLINSKNPEKTTYQIAILNAILITESFGEAIPYQNVERFSKSVMDAAVLEPFKKGVVTLDQYRASVKAVGFINVLADMVVPTTSITSLRSSPTVMKLRDSLVKEHAGKLNDPVIVAKIDKAIVEQLKKEMVGDDAEGFYTDKKMMEKIRKSTHGIMGGFKDQQDTNKVNTVTSSLLEGYNAEDIPTLVNQARSGSYDRGKDTALGGEAAKFAARVYQNLKIIEGSCSSKIGLPVFINRRNLHFYMGRYIVGGTEKQGLDKKQLNALIGKTVYVRSPLTCKTPDGNICAICCGDQVTSLKIQPGPLHAQLGSRFLDISLSAFHGKELKTVRYDPMLSLKK